VYDIGGGKILGTGISGMVRVVRHLTTGNAYAMKTLHLNRLKSKASLADLRNEVRIMSELDHPNIVQLYETFETDDHIFLIMELCTGGELLDKLHRQEGHHYSEQVASQLVKKMVGAIRYCHDHHIAHRDLKLENFLFENDNPDAELKLIDFGLSRHYQ
jgi:calcium-dependent protein kinase